MFETCTALLCLSTLGGVVTLNLSFPEIIVFRLQLAAWPPRKVPLSTTHYETRPRVKGRSLTSARSCTAFPHDFLELAVHLIFVLFFHLVYYCTVAGAGLVFPSVRRGVRCS